MELIIKIIKLNSDLKNNLLKKNQIIKLSNYQIIRLSDYITKNKYKTI